MDASQPLEVFLASSLSHDQLLALARHGAQARVSELRNEIAAIEQAFPDLRSRRGGRPRKQASAAQPAAAAADESAPARTGRRGWTAAQRKAAADRMRAFWAKRKAGRKQ
jgi:hypothetical protein